ncbi:MAG: zf-TFIIB domain-containing protein [Spirochaetes bacterium]|nr:zf-TFIIB domain-containing protein [Spirochaetota bacterium]
MAVDFPKMMNSLSNKGGGNTPKDSRYPGYQADILAAIVKQLQVENLSPSKRFCPECGKNFYLVNFNDLQLDACRYCRSIWFDMNELKLTTRLKSDVPSQDLTERQSKYKCPVCGKQMKEYVFRAPDNILVDQCIERHGVYLQGGELERIFKNMNR